MCFVLSLTGIASSIYLDAISSRLKDLLSFNDRSWSSLTDQRFNARILMNSNLSLTWNFLLQTLYNILLCRRKQEG